MSRPAGEPHGDYLRRAALGVGAVAAGGFLADYLLNLGLTRSLGAHEYGDYKVAYAFAHFFGLAVLLGGDRAAPMVLAPSIERGERRAVWEYLRFYLRNGALLALGVAAVVWTLSALHAGSADPADHHPLAWVVVVLPLSAAGAMFSRTLQSAKRPAQAALPWRIGLPAIQLALLGLIVLVQGTLGLVEAVLVGVAATAAIAAGQWLQLRRLGLVEMARAPEPGRERAWLQASLPMMGSFLVALALSQSDVYFLELLGDETSVGHYAAAATAAHLVIVIQTSVVGLIAPIARPAIERGAAESRATYRRGQTVMLAAILPVGLALAATADPVLALFGPGYRDARAVLVLLAAGHVAWAAAALSTLWLQYRGRAGLVLTIAIATLAADSILNLLLIPRYGMTGAAAGTAVTLSAAALAVVVMGRERKPETGR